MDTDPEWLAQYMTDFGFDRALYTYEAEGFAPYRERYKALCVNLGRHVTYDGGAGTAVDVEMCIRDRFKSAKWGLNEYDFSPKLSIFSSVFSLLNFSISFSAEKNGTKC